MEIRRWTVPVAGLLLGALGACDSRPSPAGINHVSCGVAPAWSIETIETARDWPQDTSIVLDGAGAPHIAYNRGDTGGIGHATKRGATWEIEAVDHVFLNGYVGDWTLSLAVDAGDAMHLVYSANRELRYATNVGGTWLPEIVREERTLSWIASLAVAPAGTLHVAYLGDCALREGLWYSTKTSGVWSHACAAEPGFEESFSTSTSLAIDAKGTAHACYGVEHAMGIRSVRLATRAEDGSWTREHVGEPGGSCSLAIDAEGIPHVAHAAPGIPGIYHSVRHGDGWSTDVVDPEGNDPVVAIAPDGSVHTAYTVGMIDDGELRYATNRSGTWTIETLARGYNRYVSLAVDAEGAAHLSYLSLWRDGWGDAFPRHSQIRYATNRGGLDAADERCPDAG